jgi:hypothetical protein
VFSALVGNCTGVMNDNNRLEGMQGVLRFEAALITGGRLLRNSSNVELTSSSPSGPSIRHSSSSRNAYHNFNRHVAFPAPPSSHEFTSSSFPQQ